MRYRVKATYVNGDASYTPWTENYLTVCTWLQDTNEDPQCLTALLEEDKDKDNVPDTDLEVEFTD
jgi:hypothetical protein